MNIYQESLIRHKRPPHIHLNLLEGQQQTIWRTHEYSHNLRTQLTHFEPFLIYTEDWFRITLWTYHIKLLNSTSLQVKQILCIKTFCMNHTRSPFNCYIRQNYPLIYWNLCRRCLSDSVIVALQRRKPIFFHTVQTKSSIVLNIKNTLL